MRSAPRPFRVVHQFEICRALTPLSRSGFRSYMFSKKREITAEDVADLVDAAAPKPGRPATYKKREKAAV